MAYRLRKEKSTIFALRDKSGTLRYTHPKIKTILEEFYTQLYKGGEVDCVSQKDYLSKTKNYTDRRREGLNQPFTINEIV